MEALRGWITRTKVVVPRRRSDLLSRQRLLDLFFDDLLDYKLILITAPAGYGKTSLLVDVTNHTELPVCWYALDPLDRDPQRFLAHFIAALAQAFPDFGQQSAALLNSVTLAEDTLDRLVVTIVNEAYEHIREHFIYVLDDYHLVNDNKLINCFVDSFIQYVDENCHLVLPSRRLLSLPTLVLMAGRSQVAGLGLHDLAFQPNEIQALILQNYHQVASKDVAEALARETEGWITGLLLSAQTMYQGMTDRLRLARASGIGVYDYLAQQVLEQQPAAVQDFLLRTSLLEEFDADLCQAVLGPANYSNGEDWPDLMDTVVRHNLFVLPVGDEGTWLRYHHLFQDFLQNRMEATRPDERRHILYRLADVSAGRQAWEKAYDLYRRLGNIDAVADLIERAGLSLTKNGQFATLAKWIEALPVEVATSRVDLLFLHGFVATTLGEVERGVSLLSQAEAASRAANDIPQLTRTLVRRAVAYRFQGNYQAALADTQEALTLTKPDEKMHIIHAEALRERGLNLYYVGRVGEAIEFMEQSLVLYNELDETERLAVLLIDLGLAYMSIGRYEQALTYYNQALEFWSTMNNIVRQADLFNNLGVLYHLRGDYERASSTFEKAISCARQSSYARIEAYALCSIGDLYTDLDALDAALNAYHQTREVLQHTDERFLLLYLDVVEAGLARLQEDTTRAQDLLNSAQQLAQDSSSGYEQALYHLGMGRLALAEGHISKATAHLERASRSFAEGGQQVDGIKARLHLATAYDRAGDRSAALSQLGQVFELAAGLESDHPLLVAGRAVKELLEAFQNEPAVGQQVTQLRQEIAHFEQDIPLLRRRLRRQALAVPFVPPKITILALGRTLVLMDDQPVTSPEWQKQRQVREFFFCLLAHPEGLDKEAIATLLWPDSSSSQFTMQFRNLLYRLRRALGKEVISLDEGEDRYYFNRQLDYEYDVELFQQAIERAQAMSPSWEQMAAYRAALERYQGPFLPKVEGTWVWLERERLRQLYLEAILRLTQLQLEMGEYNLALQYCRQALAEDPTIEELHRQAMRAYAALGDRAGVTRQFKWCQQALLAEVDAPVSVETQSLYESLIR
jgi:ATP/maltotriose-dependent transcriptional regulator MalT/DNA-binding SARP family transcriptional activator